VGGTPAGSLGLSLAILSHAVRPAMIRKMHLLPLRGYGPGPSTHVLPGSAPSVVCEIHYRPTILAWCRVCGSSRPPLEGRGSGYRPRTDSHIPPDVWPGSSLYPPDEPPESRGGER
jgi:hypothetical protein